MCIASARMRQKVTVVGSVSLCVCYLNLTFPMFVCLTNDTTYLTGNEGQKVRAVLSENAQLQSYSGSSIVRLMRSRPFLSLWKKCHIFDHVAESGHFVSRSVTSPVL